MESYTILDENWETLLSFFPPGWDRQAAVSGALRRMRGFDSESTLMRTLLLHVGPGYSLRETVVRARAAGIAEVSDVALLKRLRQSEPWLHWMCQELFRENGLTVPASPGGWRVRLVDATRVKEPGKTGSQWRLHYSLQLPDLRCDYFALTPGKGKGSGETFRQYPVQAGDLILGDRGYCTPGGIEYLAESGAYGLVRVNTGALPLESPSGRPFRLREKLGRLTEAGQVGHWTAQVPGPTRSIAGRVCAIGKSQQAIEQTHRRLERRANRSGVRTKPETLDYARFVIVFTTVPAHEVSAQEILEWYRARWQIELVFKRLKSLAQLGHLPKYDDQSSRAWLYGKLLVALLTHKLIRVGRDISPWGYLIQGLGPSQCMA